METIRKKVPYEGCTLESDKAGKMHTVLLETCMAPQTQCKTILLLQNVFFKMSESEHSLMEFYDLGELSDAEMLQLPVPTHTIVSRSPLLTMLTPKQQKESHTSQMKILRIITSHHQANVKKTT